MTRIAIIVLSIWTVFVFVQSLFFKFTNAAEPQIIFGKLDLWADRFGYGGVFSQSGIFSQYVIGGAELVASLLILLGLLASFKWARGLGALIGIGTMTGAIAFHLFTPLGVEVQGVIAPDGTIIHNAESFLAKEAVENGGTLVESDGGTLFYMAISVWFACLFLLWTSRDLIFGKRDA